MLCTPYLSNMQWFVASMQLHDTYHCHRVCVFILCSYDLTFQKQMYQELPHVFVHERSKRLPRRWRKFIERKREESLVDGTNIDLSFRTGGKEDTHPDIINDGELSASEGEALLKASQ